MIEHIRTVGLKGFNLDEPVPLKVIYSGRNKSGKSTRAGAIAIALYGHIPFSTAGKRPGDILDSFGDGKLLVSVVKIGGKEFGRKFSRNEKGVVSMVTQHEGKRTSKENFAVLLDKAGAPKIADIAEFMKQSSAKKVDTLFEIFPNDALSTIDTEIEKAKEDVSRIEKKKTGAEATVQRLTNSKQRYETPAGTIAAVQDEINKVETQIVELEKQVKDAELEDTRVKAEEKGKQDEKDRVKKEAEEKYFEEDDPSGMSGDDALKMIGSMSPGEGHEQIIPENDGDNYIESFPVMPGNFHTDPLEAEIQKGEQQLENYKAGEVSEPFLPEDDCSIDCVFVGVRERTTMSISIQRIIDALTGAGCGTCAALIVAKQELKKFKGVS